jgi:phosphoserine phosphatase RsbU/P
MKSQMDNIRTRTMVFRYASIILLATYLLIQLIMSFGEDDMMSSQSGITLQDWKKGRKYAMLPKIRAGGFVVVAKVDSGSIAEKANVNVGDTIVAVDGILLKDKPQLYYRLINVPMAKSISLDLKREGKLLHRTLKLKADTDEHDTLFAIVANVDYVPIVTAVVLLIVGVLIGWMKIRDPIAYVCSIFFLCWGIGMSGEGFGSWLPYWGIVVTVTSVAIAESMVFPLGWRLFSVFPNTSRVGAFMWRWQWIPFMLFGLAGFIHYTQHLGDLFAWQVIASLMEEFESVAEPINFSLMAIVCLFIIPLYFSQRKATRDRPEARFRIIELSLLTFGISLLTVLFLVLVQGALKNLWRDVPEFVQTIFFVAIISSFVVWMLSNFAVPVSFAYAILTRKIFGIKFIIRKGLQHLFLSKGALIIEGIILFLILYQIISRGGTALASSPMLVSGLSFGLGVLGVFTLNKVNRKVMPAIDRRYFREVLDVKRLLMELSEKLSEMKEREKILQHTASTVLKALHSARVVFLLKESGSQEFKCVLVNEHELKNPTQKGVIARSNTDEVARDSQRQLLSLRDDDSIIKQLEEKKGWAIVYPEKLDLEKEEDMQLSMINCELLIAIRGSSGLVGIMGLGGKLSEEPYSKEDRELLMTVAREMGLSLENAKLLEVAKREAEMSRDLEIARQVQQNLFPKQLPVVAGWEFAGICKPAKAVGGDYYDIFEAVPGKVVVALGDVSGKGLGASFLMSSVHGSIRTRVTSCINEPLKLIEELNAYLLSSTSKNIFVTLFFGIIDLETGKLSYVNCGHPPAIVIRQERNQQERLTRNGPGLSMLASARFSQGECQLQSGDAIVVYSDGVTEAKNNREEMYEEERLSELLNNASGLEATAIMDKILESVDQFASGAEQADDISVIAVKRKR